MTTTARRRPSRSPARTQRWARSDSWPPRWLTPVPDEDLARGDGDHAVRWIETLCRTTKDTVAGPANEPLGLRDWERALLSGVFARRPDGRLRHRRGLIGVARKNGKSALGAGLALYGLLSDYPDGPQGREIYSCAGDRMQAKIVFDAAKRMIELESTLAGVVKLYRDAIEVPKTGSIYRVLSAEAYSKEGLSPTMTIFDEVHVQADRSLWDVMALAMGARPEPLMLGITTAGVRYDALGHDTLCYQLYEHGKRVASGEETDPGFYFAWWEPSELTADFRDPKTWAEANPGLGDIVAEEDFEFALTTTPESEFRTKRCNQWVSAATAWLPFGAWDSLEDPERLIEPGQRVVLGFDGSLNNDATGIVAVTVPPKPPDVDLDQPVVQELDELYKPIAEVVELWERPKDAYEGWTVPIADVEQTIFEACHRFEVVEIACDPARWSKTFQKLADAGLPVVEFPNSPERMIPAVQRAYEGVVNRNLTHNGDGRLARHLGNAVTKETSRGRYITRNTRSHAAGHRPYMDLAIAFVQAYHRACWWQAQAEIEPLIAWSR